MKKVLQIFLLILNLSSWAFADVKSQIAQLDKEDKEQITILLQKVENQLNKYLFSDISEAISQSKNLIVDKDDENRVTLMENKVIDKQKIYDLYTNMISSIDNNSYNDSLYQQLKVLAKDSNDKELIIKIDSYYNKSGFNRLGYNIEGYDKDGYDKNGYNKSGYDKSGYDKSGRDKNGYDRSGYNKSGYDRNGYNKLGYSISGYDKDGYDKSGRDKNGYDRNGYDKNGFNSSGWNANLINKTTKTKYDSSGYDYYGYDKSGYNTSGWNANGINKYTGTKYNKNNKDKYGNYNPSKIDLSYKIKNTANYGGRNTYIYIYSYGLEKDIESYYYYEDNTWWIYVGSRSYTYNESGSKYLMDFKNGKSRNVSGLDSAIDEAIKLYIESQY